MSTALVRLFLFFMVFFAVAPLVARVESTKEKGKAPAVKFFAVPVQDKKRVPLVFSYEKKPSTKKEKSTVYKQFSLVTNKPLKKMTETELRKASDLAISLDIYEEALRYLSRLLAETKNTRTAKELRLEISDINFERGALKLSAEGYLDFLKFYPGDDHAEYAQYKGLLSNFYAISKADRDQTATYNTISLADSFLAKSDVYKHYNDDVKQIRLSCYNRLYDHEVTVFEYYMKKGSTKAAETRLSALKKSYIKKLPNLEPAILHLEYRLAQAKNDTDTAKKIYYRLASNFPHYSLKLV